MNMTQRHLADATATRRHRRLLSAAVAAAVLVTVAPASIAATKVTVTNPGGLTAVGPVNPEYGFPAWYEDSTKTRVEPCLDGDNPLCGFLPGDIPIEGQPISFPDNFPGEFFYQLIDSSLDLPGGGSATLTLGVEAAFANEEPIAGDQQTFARTRVVVKGAPASTTLTFKHPFGELTIDTDGDGAGRLVQDITPAIGNFETPLKGNFGPFLRWDPATGPAAPEGYLGDPAIPHAVIGGKGGYNQFSVTGGGLDVSTDEFGVSGKIATNTGLVGDRAVINGEYLDVFATSDGTQLEVPGVDGQYLTTPMVSDGGSSRHYARIALHNGASPTEVTVRNLGDKPVSSAVIKISDVSVIEASYDGTSLKVAATGNFPLTVVGFGTLPDAQPVEWTVTAPPAQVTVKSSTGGSVTNPVTITGGVATEPGQPAIDPEPAGPPVTDNTPDNPTPDQPVAANIAPVTTETLPGGTVTVDGSGSTLAESYAWSQVSGPTVTFSSATVAKPTVTLPYYTSTSANAVSAAWEPIALKLTVTDAQGATSEATVELPVKTDVLQVTAARHRLRTELRISGTSLIDGAAGVLTPPTRVVVWSTDANGVALTKLGTADVDTLGAWSVRLKPGPSTQVNQVRVQATRGGDASSAVTTR